MDSLEALSAECFKRRIEESVATSCTTNQLSQIASYIKDALPVKLWQRSFSNFINSKEVLKSCSRVRNDDFHFIADHLKLEVTPVDLMGYWNRFTLSHYFDSTVGYFLLARSTLPTLSQFNFEKYTKVVLIDLTEKVDKGCDLFKQQMCTMFATFSSVKILEIHGCSCRLLYRLVSKCLPSLQHFSLSSIIEAEHINECLIYLAGFDASKVKKYENVKSRLNRARNQCKDLRTIYLGHCNVSVSTLAILLGSFPHLETIKGLEYNFSTHVILKEHFGHNVDNYGKISTTFNTRMAFTDYEVISVDDCYLLTKACRNLVYVNLKFSSKERQDKNVLSVLATLEHLKSVKVLDPSLSALIWFLKKKGLSLKGFSLTTSYSNSFEITITDFNRIFLYCRNVELLQLRLFGCSFTNPDKVKPIEEFELKNLKYLSLGIIKLGTLKYIKFLFKSSLLELLEMRCATPIPPQTFDILFDLPAFKSIKMFVNLRVVSADRINHVFSKCPQLCHSLLSTKDDEVYESVIREANVKGRHCRVLAPFEVETDYWTTEYNSFKHLSMSNRFFLMESDNIKQCVCSLRTRNDVVRQCF